MHRLFILIAILSLIGSLYYFFIEKNLFTGSIFLILAIVFNLAYAMMQRVNVIKK